MTSLPEFINVVCRERDAVLMGVLNATPDSFFDGGRYTEQAAIQRRVDSLLAQGADIIDIGGESTRPGAEAVPAEQQLSRIMPAVEYAVSRGALVSIDTTQSEVARRCIAEGAQLINDVSCLSNATLARVVAEGGASLILMHSRGSMSTMPGFSSYDENAYEDVVSDVERQWLAQRDRAEREGLPRSSILFDPGLGFHKSAGHSWELLRSTHRFRQLGHHICVGASRKSFLGSLDGSGPEDRLGGTIAACLHAATAGAQILRVHDVAVVRQALATQRVLRQREEGGQGALSAGRSSSFRMRHDA